MITLGKKPSLANRRLAFDRLRDRGIVEKLFDNLGPRYAKRNGGYLRILKTGFRKATTPARARQPDGQVRSRRLAGAREKAQERREEGRQDA